MMEEFAPKRPRLRSLIFVVGLIVALGAYAGLVGLVHDKMGQVSKVVDLIFYLFAGIIWIFPARYAVRWLYKD